MNKLVTSDEMKVVVVTIVEKDGKILMIQEAKEKAYKQWFFPAGHLEKDENIIYGAVREAKEETGYDIKINKLVQIFSPTVDYPLMFVFAGEVLSGSKHISDPAEILDIEWIPIGEVPDKDLRIRKRTTEILEKYKSGKLYSVDMINKRLVSINEEER